MSNRGLRPVVDDPTKIRCRRLGVYMRGFHALRDRRTLCPALPWSLAMTVEVLGPGEGERGCRSRRRRLAGWGSWRVPRAPHGRDRRGDLREEPAERLVAVERLALGLCFLVLLQFVAPDPDRRSRRRPQRPSSSPRPSKVGLTAG